MKRNLLLFIVYSFTNFIQAQTNDEVLQIISRKKGELQKMEYTVKEPSSIQQRGSGICDSLIVQPTPDNGFDGVMFDMHVLNFVTLETFSMSLDAGNPWVAIFYRPGSYLGNNTTSTGWIMLDSIQIAVSVDGIVKIPVDVNLPLLADSNYAFYVTVIDNVTGCNYKDGSSVGSIAASDFNIEIREGAGGEYPFSVTNSPRVLVGSAYYCQVATSTEESVLENEFDILPNPVNDQLFISGKLAIEALEISDYTGRFIKSNNHDQKIDCIDLADGVYFLRITSGGKTFVKKFIKQ